jgi:regulator of sigma E protease
VFGGYPFPPLVDSVQPDSAALDAKLKKGDVVVAINGQRIHAFSELQEAVRSSDGNELTLDVWRDGETMALMMTPRRVDLPDGNGGFTTNWMIGMTGGLLFEPETTIPGVTEAVGLAANQITFIVESSLSALYHMAVGSISSCNLRGVIGIAQTSSAAASQGIDTFIWFIAVLSVAIGMINLFPIPVLDGGHLVFHAYEAIVGRPPSDRVMNILFPLGLVFVLGIMLFGLSNDLFCP